MVCSGIKSSFNGNISEIPGISVDNFERHNLKSQAFFLSHCHSDHTKGLFTPELLKALENYKLLIYTSELSKAIIEDDCNNDGVLMKHIKPLGLGTNDINLPEVFGYNEASLRVTVITAGHCLGSVMFLFETNDKRTILYTGDFNLSSNDITHMVQFHGKNKDPIKIDTMYIDTTFISSQYEYFPKRHKVIDEMIIFIKKWLTENESNRVALNTSAKYGYEYVFNQISRKMNLKVFVNDERWRFYSKHPSLLKGITNMEENTKIHVCRENSEKSIHKSCAITNSQEYKYLFIRLSAMKWSNYNLEESAINQIASNRLDVCFPTHCSRTEIINFVNYFTPRKVVGFPNKYPQFQHKRQNISSNMTEIKPKKKMMKFNRDNETDKKVDMGLLKKIFDL